MKTILITLFAILAFVTIAAADTYVVNNTADPGNGTCDAAGCTLQEAIDAANANPGADVINFNIPGTSVHTITITSGLPVITETVAIDGYTQPGALENTLETGNNAVLVIELDGASAALVSGLFITAPDCLIRGLVINGFRGSGIALGAGASGNVIEGNFIGTDPAGSADLGNDFSGVSIFSANDNLVGGTLPAARNLISGNTEAGVEIFSDSTGNLIQGNYLGTDRNGLAALPNGEDGVRISNDAPANVIGGTVAGAGNLISGNGQHGVSITNAFGGESPDNLIQGNFIGTDATGAGALPNAENGVFIEGEDNNLVGGTEPGARNIISGNGTDGVLISGSAIGNSVQGNYVGTDATGTMGMGNVSHGVELDGASRNGIGGTIAGARNVISGNSDDGVRIINGATQNGVTGNYIGTDAGGITALGNETGVNVCGSAGNFIGGPTIGSGNVISGNFIGVRIVCSGATSNLVQGNLIGVDATGSGPLGNQSTGVDLDIGSSDSIVGGPDGAGNIIAYNGASVSASGIAILGSGNTGNTILANSIFSNSLLGIDLFGGSEDANSVTANDFPDSDLGPNDLQNYPVIDEIAVDGEERSVDGSLISNPNTDYVLNFYSNSEVDPSGHGEGETWLGSLDVHTNAQSMVDFSFPLESDALGRFITATATDPNGNTSEFSMASQLVPPLNRFLNISTRLRVQTGDNVLIGGFIIDGTDAKQVIVRTIGPSLGDFGVTDPLANPILELHYPDGTTVVTNNNWKDDQESEIIATGLAPSDDLESAIVANLDPGLYTAVVTGANGGTGVGLVEAYDLSQTADSALGNISTRGLVETGDNVMIGGIIVGPDQAVEGSILLRGIGPSLSNFGITNPLADPMLELRDGNGALVMANDNWKSTQQAAIEATGLQPSDDKEAAILATLGADAYTAILSGVGNTTGIALVEAYHLDD